MGGNVWDAEHALDVHAAQALLAAQFPALALDSVVELAYGFDNTVFVVDGTWAVRFPRRQPPRNSSTKRSSATCRIASPAPHAPRVDMHELLVGVVADAACLQ